MIDSVEFFCPNCDEKVNYPATFCPHCNSVLSRVDEKLSSLNQKRKLIMISIYSMCVLFGIDSVLVESTKVTIKDFLLILMFAILVTFFCVVDAKLRKKTIPDFSKWLIFFTWPISVPIYILWSRGKKKIISSILQILSFPVVVLVSAILTGIVMILIDPNLFPY